ncbi:MAG: DHHA1 domain-containing protein, partial [Clostridia bacterium]
ITFPNTIQIDHHQGNPNFARLNMVDLQASSTSEIIYSLLEYMDIVFDYNICTALLAGILTDTGSLKFCNAKPSTFKIVASLLEKGNIDISVISEKLFSSLTINQFQLNTAGMKGTRFYYNNKLAIITLLYDDLIKSNTNLSDAKGLTRFALEVEDTLMAILVCEAQKGVFYISLRSKGKTNVSKVAGSFGGGGHVNASGCRLYGNIEMVTEKLVKSAGDELC